MSSTSVEALFQAYKASRNYDILPDAVFRQSHAIKSKQKSKPPTKPPVVQEPTKSSRSRTRSRPATAPEPMRRRNTKKILTKRTSSFREKMPPVVKQESKPNMDIFRYPPVELFATRSNNDTSFEKKDLDFYYRKQIQIHTKLITAVKTNITKSETFKSYVCRGYANWRCGNLEAAVNDYTCALQIDPWHSAVYFNRSEIYARLGRDQEAIADLTKAISCDSGTYLERMYTNRAMIYRHGGNIEKAIFDYSVIKELQNQRQIADSPQQEVAMRNTDNVVWTKRTSVLANSLNIPPAGRSESDIQLIASLLGSVNAIKNVPIRSLEAFAKFASYKKFELGMQVWEGGSACHGVYLILSGTITVEIDSDERDDVLPADMFGTQSLNTSRQHIALYPSMMLSDGCAGLHVASSLGLSLESQLVSAYAETDAETLFFDPALIREKYQREAMVALQEYDKWQLNDRVRQLKQSPVFSEWSMSDLYLVARRARVRHYAENTTLVRQGETISELLILNIGVCRATKRIDISKTASIVKPNPLKAGSFENAMIDVLRYQREPPPSAKALDEMVNFEVSILTSGQVINELVCLEPNKEYHSPITVEAATNVDILVISKEVIQAIESFANRSTVIYLRDSFTRTYKTNHRLREVYKEQHRWTSLKRDIMRERNESFQHNKFMKRFGGGF